MSPAPRLPNRIRIIGGRLRGRRLPFPDAQGLRPTPDRVRETLFNWLGQDLTGRRCLDLFAGSGALGFEAASRGASAVVMVERAPAVWRSLTQVLVEIGPLPVELVRADALEFLPRCAGRFDVVFVDPPFAGDDRETVLGLLPERLAPHGLVYCEAPLGWAPPVGWETVRDGRAGNVNFQLLRTGESAQGDLPRDL